MKFSGKMWLMIILNVTKNQGLDLSLEDKFTEKPQKGSNWPPAFLGLSILYYMHTHERQMSAFELTLYNENSNKCQKLFDKTEVKIYLKTDLSMEDTKYLKK